MTGHRITLIHTVTSLPALFRPICARLLPDGTEVTNVVDDSLLGDTRRAGTVTPQVARRLAGHVWSAQDGGADVIMVTCSSMGTVVNLLEPFTAVPLLRVDEAMVRAAVERGSRVGVAATLSTTLQPTADLVRRVSASLDRPVKLTTQLCEGAFDAAVTGDTTRHDELVRYGVQELSRQVDVVVLAQASMAGALSDDVPEVPVLSSPELAVAGLAEVLH
jgi:aspartate/glutamate racemase